MSLFKTFLFWILILFNFPALSQDKKEKVRVPKDLSSYTSDEDFIYGEKADTENFSIDWSWLTDWLEKVFGSNEGGQAWRIFIWTIVGLGAASVITLLINTRTSNLIHGKTASAGGEMYVDDENIHEIPLNELLENAVKEGRYREAVRYRFLMLLKYLSENNIINWYPEKTNRDYLREVSGSRASTAFSQAVSAYEYTWYGNYILDLEGWKIKKQVFDEAQNKFNETQG